jgi:hypothetical protein
LGHAISYGVEVPTEVIQKSGFAPNLALEPGFLGHGVNLAAEFKTEVFGDDKDKTLRRLSNSALNLGFVSL